MSGAAIAPAIPVLEAGLVAEGQPAPLLARAALIMPALVIMLSGVVMGRLTGRVDQRLGFCLSLCALAFFGVIGGLASGYGFLLLSRVGLGLATAAVLCFATAAIAAHYQGAERGRVIGRKAAVNTFGGVIFVLCGGALAGIAWQAPFVLYLLAVPVAVLVAGRSWRSPGTVQQTAVPLGPILLELGLLVMAMGAFYLMPVQVPFVPALSEAPVQSGLVIAAATLASGIASLIVASRAGHAPGAVRSGALVLLLTGLAICSLVGSLPGYLLAAVLIGVAFGALLPVLISAIMARSTPQTAHGLSGLIATALYAGQVLAAFFAPSVGAIDPRAPFAAFAVLSALALLLYLYGASLRPAGRWLWERAA